MSKRYYLAIHLRSTWKEPRAVKPQMMSAPLSLSNFRLIATQAQDFGIHSTESSNPKGFSETSSEPPDLPVHCCMSGCANCVWLEYAEEVVKYYERKGAKLKLDQLLQDIEDNLNDEMIKAFVKMEVKFAYGKKLSS